MMIVVLARVVGVLGEGSAARRCNCPAARLKGLEAWGRREPWHAASRHL